MKYRTMAMILLLAAVILPTQGREIGELIPVAVLSVALDEQMNDVVLETDTGNMGIGETLDAAMKELQATASGEVLLDTVEYVIAEEECRATLMELKRVLRPSVRICKGEGGIDLAEAWQYLQMHTPSVKLADLSEETVLPVLARIEERFCLEE